MNTGGTTLKGWFGRPDLSLWSHRAYRTEVAVAPRYDRVEGVVQNLYS